MHMLIEMQRVYSVSRMFVNTACHVTDVLWDEVNAKSDLHVRSPALTPVAGIPGPAGPLERSGHPERLTEGKPT